MGDVIEAEVIIFEDLGIEVLSFSVLDIKEVEENYFLFILILYRILIDKVENMNVKLYSLVQNFFRNI